MDKQVKFDTIDRFIEEFTEKGTSSVVCPVCKTSLELVGNSSAYTVQCKTPNCLKETYRGL